MNEAKEGTDPRLKKAALFWTKGKTIVGALGALFALAGACVTFGIWTNNLQLSTENTAKAHHELAKSVQKLAEQIYSHTVTPSHSKQEATNHELRAIIHGVDSRLTHHIKASDAQAERWFKGEWAEHLKRYRALARKVDTITSRSRDE